MAEKIGDSEAILEGLVTRMESRQDVLDQGIPFQFAFLHEKADGGCRGSFGEGADGEDGVLGDREACFGVAMAVVGVVDGVAVRDDVETQTGGSTDLHQLFNRGAEAGRAAGRAGRIESAMAARKV